MATFFSEGKTNFVSYITGPSHILLGLEFGACTDTPPEIEARLAFGNCDHGPINTMKLLDAVIQGIADANQTNNARLCVHKIIYVVNDSTQYPMYQHCARLIAQRIATGGTFDSTMQ